MLIQFWIVGPVELPDKLGLCFFTERALGNLIRLVSKDSNLAEENVNKTRLRLGLVPASPRRGWVRDIKVVGRKLVPVFSET